MTHKNGCTRHIWYIACCMSSIKDSTPEVVSNICNVFGNKVSVMIFLFLVKESFPERFCSFWMMNFNQQLSSPNWKNPHPKLTAQEKVKQFNTTTINWPLCNLVKCQILFRKFHRLWQLANLIEKQNLFIIKDKRLSNHFHKWWNVDYIQRKKECLWPKEAPAVVSVLKQGLYSIFEGSCLIQSTELQTVE